MGKLNIPDKPSTTGKVYHMVYGISCSVIKGTFKGIGLRVVTQEYHG
jgi:hypothetical protein